MKQSISNAVMSITLRRCSRSIVVGPGLHPYTQIHSRQTFPKQVKNRKVKLFYFTYKLNRSRQIAARYVRRQQASSLSSWDAFAHEILQEKWRVKSIRVAPQPQRGGGSRPHAAPVTMNTAVVGGVWSKWDSWNWDWIRNWGECLLKNDSVNPVNGKDII